MIRRRYAAVALLTLPSLTLMVSSSATEASARPAFAALRGVATDTIPPVRGGISDRRLFFTPRYLTRIVKGVTADSVEKAVAEKEAAEHENVAARYARRYGIPLDLSRQIVRSALAEGVDPELGFRLVRVESVFKPNARGPSGSLGLTQLMPSTARAIDRSLRTEAQILDPATNLRTGFRYLREMIERYDGNVRLGVLAYNRGEGAVDRALRAGRDPENGYSPKVLGTETNRYSGTGLVERRAGD